MICSNASRAVIHVPCIFCQMATYLASVELLLLQGAQAHAAGVLFPSDDDTLHRTILIANINPLVNTEQVRDVCMVFFRAFCCVSTL